MALPAILALAAIGPLRIHTRGRWGSELYAGMDVTDGEQAPVGEIGVLLKSSLAAAWRWRALSQRIGIGPLLTTDVGNRLEHRRERYARIVAAAGAGPVGMPRYLPRGQSPTLPDGFVALNPWSPSPTVRWPHFRELADRVGTAVFFAGPGEAAEVAAIAGPHRVVEGLVLPDFAAALDRASVFVTGDTGAGHFAAACGVRVVMLHGSTTAARTGAGTPIEGPDMWCRPCYRKWCPFQIGCLRGIDVERVVDATRASPPGIRAT